MPGTEFMQEALNLASLGIGKTYPNPMVGAVIVKKGRIIGRGYHKKFGAPHAEIEALKSCKESTSESTMYVTLTPCSHHGKTPPCTDAIIKAGISKVYCSVSDTNPTVARMGVEKLHASGVEVEVGLLKDKAIKLNETFFAFNKLNRPFIALKYAASKNNRVPKGDGKPVWVTNEKSQAYGKKLRKKYMSILVGINTVLADDPHLGDSLRIILDPGLKIPESSQVLRDKNVLLVTTEKAYKQKIKDLNQKGFEILKFNENKISLKKLLDYLKRRQIISVFVEGGPTTQAEFIKAGLYDKIYAFNSPKEIDEENSLPTLGGLKPNLKTNSIQKFGNDLLITSYPV